MKEVLCDQNHADIPVMAAVSKEVTHLLGIDVVQQIVEDHEARSAASGFFAIAPDHPAVEIPFHTQGVEVLQEPQAERRFARSPRSTYYAREVVLKFKVFTHG